MLTGPGLMTNSKRTLMEGEDHIHEEHSIYTIINNYKSTRYALAIEANLERNEEGVVEDETDNGHVPAELPFCIRRDVEAPSPASGPLG